MSDELERAADEPDAANRTNGDAPDSGREHEAETLSDGGGEQPAVANRSDVRGSPLRTLLTVVVAVALALTVALQPGWLGTRTPWLVMLGAYVGLAAWSLVDLGRRGLLGERFRVRPGDTSIGIVLGLALAVAGVLGQQVMATPGSAGAQWLLEVYLAAGDYQTDGLSIFVLLAIAACEESVWRGMVQDQLRERNERSAPLLTALGYAAATTPSVFLLSADKSGNPVLLLSALGTGFVWSYARRVVPRLFPLIIAHLVFTYFMAAPLPHWL